MSGRCIVRITSSGPWRITSSGGLHHQDPGRLTRRNSVPSCWPVKITKAATGSAQAMCHTALIAWPLSAIIDIYAHRADSAASALKAALPVAAASNRYSPDRGFPLFITLSSVVLLPVGLLLGTSNDGGKSSGCVAQV